MAITVYVLYSRTKGETYVGQTGNVERRLASHNGGRVRSTRGGAPWELVEQEEYATRAEAVVRERWYKSRSGRRRIHELLKEKSVL